MREVGSSNPGGGRGSIVGGIVHPTKVTGNLSRVSPRGEVVKYRPYPPPSFEVAKPRNITAYSAIIII